MTLKIAYNNKSEPLVTEILENKYPNLTVICYNEDNYKEKKEAFTIKGSWGARVAPFAILLDDNNKGIKAFYSESEECTFDNINNTLIMYE